MRWPILIIAAALAGCAGSPWAESESQRRVEEAKNIPPIDYKADAIAFLRTYLNDPTRVRNAAISQPELKTVGSIPRFVACVRFNAKKSNGQYAGLKDNAAVFISGKLDRLIELGGTGEEAERNKPLREFCAAAAYEPFPELERLTR
ncbi:MAG: hypothetical protein QOJ96_2569 [Alphaproteobacteria bacterium]|jgi:hypothetical protein|nr:hypothetical protein [Alphaproteobacteria bacterium]